MAPFLHAVYALRLVIATNAAPMHSNSKVSEASPLGREAQCPELAKADLGLSQTDSLFDRTDQ
jgi:hypothetical protein